MNTPMTRKQFLAEREDGRTNFSNADMRDIDLSGLDLHGLNFSRANLSGANLDDDERYTPETITRGFLPLYGVI